MLETAGYPNEKGALRRVASRLGVEEATLSRWARRVQNPPPDQLVSEKRDALADMMNRVFFGFSGELLARIAEGSLIDEPTSTIITGLGVSFDKRQLLNNKPTAINGVSRIESQLEDLPRDEYDALIREAEEIIANHGGADTRSA